jgi:hypothetical protein
MRIRFVLTAVVAVVLLTAVPAGAHQPLLLGEGDASPADGPRIPDGTISFAVYGSLDEAGETRGFRVGFQSGEEIVVGLLIPDLAPERDLADEALPRLTMIAPDGTETPLLPVRGEPFLEPFSGTSYVELGEWRSVADAGTYGFSITGDAAARFTVSVGVRELFGTPVEDEDRPTGLGDVAVWYDTPPGGTPAPDEASPGGGGFPIFTVVTGAAAATVFAALWWVGRRRRTRATPPAGG